MIEFNYADRPLVKEEVDTRDLDCLDKDSPTSINDFLKLYAYDRSFSPPEGSFVFDSDFGDIDLDNDISPSLDYDFEEAKEDDEKRARNI